MATCPKCAEQIPDTATQCPHCDSLIKSGVYINIVKFWRGLGLAKKILFIFAIIILATSAYAASNWRKIKNNFVEMRCSMGDCESCMKNAATYHGYGKSEINRDYMKTYECYMVECESGEMESCKIAAAIAAHRIENADVRLYAAARLAINKDLETRCDQGNADACLEIGKWSKDFENGAQNKQIGSNGYINTNEWYAKAVKISESDCEEDIYQSCLTAGKYYIEGVHVEYDMRSAVLYLQKACSNNVSPACDYMELVKKRYPTAFARYTTGYNKPNYGAPRNTSEDENNGNKDGDAAKKTADNATESEKNAEEPGDDGNSSFSVAGVPDISTNVPEDRARKTATNARLCLKTLNSC